MPLATTLPATDPSPLRRVLVAFGTRPEAIKMAPLVKEFQRRPNTFETICCVTGQHRQLLDQVLDVFGVTPDYDLNIMQAGQDLFDVTSRVLLGVRDLLRATRPHIVFVHGDTTTSTATALAAFYEQIPVAHIEAGLRTHDIYSPWPEEMNRQITGRLATMHFAPTETGRTNLLAEGVSPDRIVVTGNTVIDALHLVRARLADESSLRSQVTRTVFEAGYDVSRLVDGRRLVLITGHRRENFGAPFRSVCAAIRDLAVRYPSVDFLYPVHPNPNVRDPIRDIFGPDPKPNVFLVDPLDYLSFVLLMEQSYLVLTDSGGIQEEAPSLGKPVIVMRDTTERPEAVDAGTVMLVGTDYQRIVATVSSLLDSPEQYGLLSRAINPYGDGRACIRIVDFVERAVN